MGCRNTPEILIESRSLLRQYVQILKDSTFISHTNTVNSKPKWKWRQKRILCVYQEYHKKRSEMIKKRQQNIHTRRQKKAAAQRNKLLSRSTYYSCIWADRNGRLSSPISKQSCLARALLYSCVHMTIADQPPNIHKLTYIKCVYPNNTYSVRCMCEWLSADVYMQILFVFFFLVSFWRGLFPFIFWFFTYTFFSTVFFQHLVCFFTFSFTILHCFLCCAYSVEHN